MNIDVLFLAWQESYFQKTLFVAVLFVCMAGPVGSLLLLQGRTCLASVIVHAVLLGSLVGSLAVTYLTTAGTWGPVVIVSSCIVTALALALLRAVQERTEVEQGSLATGIFIALLALVVFCVTFFQDMLRMDLQPLLLGDIFLATVNDIWFTGLVAVIVCSLIIILFRYFHLSCVDPVMAASLGISSCALNVVLVVSTTATAVSGVASLGALVMVTLLVLPQVTAYFVVRRLWQIMVVSVFSGVLSVLIGLHLSLYFDTRSLGPVIAIALLQVSVASFFAPKGFVASWFKKMQKVPETVREDLLVTILENGGFAKESVLLVSVKGSERLIRSGVRSLLQDDLLGAEQSGYTLTDKGDQRAEFLSQSRLLWRSHLVNIDVEQDEVDTQMADVTYVHSPELTHYFSKKIKTSQEEDVTKSIK